MHNVKYIYIDSSNIPLITVLIVYHNRQIKASITPIIIDFQLCHNVGFNRWHWNTTKHNWIRKNLLEILLIYLYSIVSHKLQILNKELTVLRESKFIITKILLLTLLTDISKIDNIEANQDKETDHFYII